MSRKILFSIIIPTHNAATTISNCLKSLLQQTFENFEILIMDGASTDATVSIAKSFHDNRIKICSEPDFGIYDAMNKGIKIAEGDWLYFLGSDDELYNNKVLELVKPFLDSGYQFTYGNVLMNNTNQAYCGKVNNIEILFKNICQQAIFYNKLIFERLNFNLSYKVYADYDLNIKFFETKYNLVQYIPILIAKYANTGYSSTQKDGFNEQLMTIRILFYSRKNLFFKFKYRIYNYQLKLKPSRFRGILMRALKLIS